MNTLTMQKMSSQEREIAAIAGPIYWGLWRIIGDTFVAVTPLLFNRARIIVADAQGVNEFWQYNSPSEAVRRAKKYALHGIAPEGWTRHQPKTGRMVRAE